MAKNMMSSFVMMTKTQILYWAYWYQHLRHVMIIVVSHTILDQLMKTLGQHVS